MKRIIEIEKEYKSNAKSAINRFFKTHSELDYWKETLEYMYENGVDFYCDNVMADGTKNNDWAYALHLDIGEGYTYICIIERA